MEEYFGDDFDAEDIYKYVRRKRKRWSYFDNAFFELLKKEILHIKLYTQYQFSIKTGNLKLIKIKQQFISA